MSTMKLNSRTIDELVFIVDSTIENGSQVAVALYMPVYPEAGKTLQIAILL